MRCFFVALCAPVLLTLATPANGAILANSLFKTGVNLIQDQDFERLEKNPNNTGGASIIEVGDVLEAIVSFDSINSVDVNGLAGFGAAYELTAHSRLVVLGFGLTDTDADGIFDSGDTDANGLTNFTFGPGFANGVAVEVYEDFPTTLATNFNAAVDAGQGVTRVTNGTLALTLGFDPTKPTNATDPDFWVAFLAPLDISVFSDPNAETIAQGGDFFFGLSVLSNPGGIPYVDEGISTGTSGFAGPPTNHDMVGNGSLSVPVGAHADWDAETNTKIFFQAVPEPSSVAIWSVVACLGGVVFSRSRRQSSRVC
jgi:hypothetical protein